MTAKIREVARRVVEELTRRLRHEMSRALAGARRPGTTSSRRSSARDIAWRATIRANLKNYDRERQVLIAERLRFHGHVRRHLPWTIVLCIDQSGSMTRSLIYSAVMAAILAGLPSVKVKLVVFDTAVVDLSDKVGDPVDILMAVQLGGGTDIGKAVAYCEQHHVTTPERTVLVLVSDFCEGAAPGPLLATVKRLAGARVTLLGLAALDDAAEPDYDESMAQMLVSAGNACRGADAGAFRALDRGADPVRTKSASLGATLAAFDDAALEAAASKGLVRRANRDHEAGLAVVTREADDAVELAVDGETVVLGPGGLAAARCSCPAQGLCRHILTAVIAMRGTAGAGPGAAGDIAPATDADADPLAELAAFAAADLVKAFGRAALRDAEAILAAVGELPEAIAIESRGAHLRHPAAGQPEVRYLAGLGLAGMIAKEPTAVAVAAKPGTKAKRKPPSIEALRAAAVLAARRWQAGDVAAAAPVESGPAVAPAATPSTDAAFLDAVNRGAGGDRPRRPRHLAPVARGATARPRAVLARRRHAATRRRVARHRRGPFRPPRPRRSLRPGDGSRCDRTDLRPGARAAP